MKYMRIYGGVSPASPPISSLRSSLLPRFSASPFPLCLFAPLSPSLSSSLPLAPLFLSPVSLLPPPTLFSLGRIEETPQQCRGNPLWRLMHTSNEQITIRKESPPSVGGTHKIRFLVHMGVITNQNSGLEMVLGPSSENFINKK